MVPATETVLVKPEMLTKEMSVAAVLSAIEKAEKKKNKAKATITKKKNALISALHEGGAFARRLSERDEVILKNAFADLGKGMITSLCGCDTCKVVLAEYKRWKHSEEAKLILKREKAPEEGAGGFVGSISNVPWEKIRTQKALGIKAATNIHPSVWAPGLTDLRDTTIYLYPHNPAPKKGVWFARPCPVVPKHGFVESRPIYPQHIKDMYRKVLKHDPQGELILMKQLTGEYSGVATESTVAFGLGNDGVTGVGNCVVSIPVSYQSLTIPYPFMAGIKVRHLYMEVVEHEGTLMLVQLRDGPKPPPAVGDYIPHEMFVERTIYCNEAGLLEWEGIIKGMIELNGGTDGLVVMLPGGSLASHWAVHAIANKVAVVTSRTTLPIGTRIKPCKGAPELTYEDITNIAERMGRWLDRDYIAGGAQGRYAKGVIASSVATIQQQHLWGNDPHLLDLRAAAIVSLVRFLSAACVGEVRYFNRNGPGTNRGVPQRTVLRGEDGFHSFGRSAIYAIYLRPVSLDVLESTMGNVFSDFMEPGWRNGEDQVRFDRYGEPKGPQNYGYGGPKWGNSAAVTEVLIRRARQFLKQPSHDTWAALIKQANVAVNTAHNNGQVLSKWLNGHFFSNVTMMPSGGFLNAFTARVCLGLQMQGVGCREDGSSE